MTPLSRRTFLAGLATASVCRRPAFAAPAALSCGAVGLRFPSERSTAKDAQSGVEVVQLTNYKGHSHHFYFTNSGWYDGGRRLLISSDRSNRTNLFGIELASGQIEQLTDLEPVSLPRELEFLRAAKNPRREEVYFWHDLDLLALDLASKRIRRLFRADPGWCLSMTNVAADGQHVYFGLWEDLSKRFRVDLLRGYVGFKEIFEARPRSRIMEVAVDTGAARVRLEERHWIGHVNTSPTQRNLLTFCHEGPWDRVDQRIWAMDTDTGRVWKVRPTSGRESVGHEYWYADGVRIGYHGRDAQGKPMIGRLRFDNTDHHETSFPGQTGHTFSLDERQIVGDGGGVIRLWQYDGTKYLPPRVLCRHDSAARIQQAHAHPRISPDGRYVIFTSDRSGYCNVYQVPLADYARLPLADVKS